MKCIYCKKEVNGKEKTNEHVIPQWIIKKLDIKKKQLSFTSISEELEVFKPITPTPHTLTHKVCASCNNGWLSDIDDSCKQFLEVVIDGNEPGKLFNFDNIEKLRILIFKILLNYLATGPNTFKQKKLKFYHDFYKTRLPPENAYLFITNFRNDINFSINHLDGWQKLNENQNIGDDGSGFRFKVYLQLGEIAFVLCSPGDKRNIIIYDNRFLFPISNQLSLPRNFDQTTSCFEPIPDTRVNRFLFNSIRAARALIIK